MVVNKETHPDQPTVLELFLEEKKLDGFMPFLQAETDEEIGSVLKEGKYLNEDVSFPATNSAFYELLRRVTGIFTPNHGSNHFESTDYWGNLLEGNYEGSLGVDDYGFVVETTNRFAAYLDKNRIHSLALPPVQKWLNEHLPLIPMLMDAKKRYSLLIETPRVVGELPYYLVHDNNRKVEGSLLFKIYDEFRSLFDGEFTKKVDGNAFDVGIHRYSFRHIQQMVANFVSSVDAESLKGQFNKDDYEVIQSVNGVAMRDLIRRKLETIRSFNDADERLERIKSHILYRVASDKPHPDDYQLELTATYNSIIREIDGVNEEIGYEQGLDDVENWLESAASFKNKDKKM